ncbi:hypothetical protein EBL_c20940 [Shimwellia blattae DSM 4481 = NBRC 105725]|uniref:Uncharacterized protein n=1 Tax=Shimwellia blattae (strain ATCC 29907 / DSM 4481 / JCM 1650 / NBRC 105725 / CDC 9005-74) TaxID=630626 RepID=I2B9I1_SHIBC|nr:hypothetical protein EBL_c20940 [Shimwellia blattae DSM 4481 = NBRC 105725]
MKINYRGVWYMICYVIAKQRKLFYFIKLYKWHFERK